MSHICRVCDIILTPENWNLSCQKQRSNICKKCENARTRVWQKANPDKVNAAYTARRRKQGQQPYTENKECGIYLGVHVAERVLSRVFKDVIVMPYGNPGYDIIYNHEKLIDIKSACMGSKGEWGFNIRYNKTADYFLCLAFDNRKDLNPIHAWLLPGGKFQHHKGISISPSTVHKWDAYKLDLSRVNACCDMMRGKL